MVTPEHLTKHRSRKGIQYRDRIRRSGEKARPLGHATVRCLEDQSPPTTPQPLTRLVEPRNSLPRAPGESEQLADPPDQRRFEHGRKIWGHSDRTASGPGEGTPQPSLGAGSLYHIPGGTQPHSPSWQRCSKVRHQRAVRAHDEADQTLLRQTLAGDDAAAEGAVFFVPRLIPTLSAP
jgi:hypothetical protein